MIPRQDIKKALPHGYIKKVASKAGVTNAAVSRFLNGGIKSSPKIEAAALEVAIDVQQKRGALINRLNELLNV